jgi:hypothetical protein
MKALEMIDNLILLENKLFSVSVDYVGDILSGRLGNEIFNLLKHQ